MNNSPFKKKMLCFALASITAAALTVSVSSHAATTDISSTPLGTRSGSNVAPNMMFILDNSGSMERNYLPDRMDGSICKSCNSGSCDITGTSCTVRNSDNDYHAGDSRRFNVGHPPFAAHQFNTLFYNPAVTYSPAVNYLNVSLGNQSVTAARHDPFDSANTNTYNVTNGNRDIFWCTISSPSSTQRADSTVCQRNGINNGAAFHYQGTGGLPSTTFNNRVIRDDLGPYYYNISPREYCTDETLVTCTQSTTATTISGVAYNVPAPVRWCRDDTVVGNTAAVTGGSPRLCQALNDGTYRYARLGLFTRVNITAGTAFTYPRASTRTDCTGPVGSAGCTGDQEMQNYANWYSYYSTRLNTMKTVPGRVFASIGNDANAGDIRAGFVTISLSSSNASTRYLGVSDFKNNTHRETWFSRLYGTTPSSSTPLREALSRVGRYYAGVKTGINDFMTDEPLTSSCQRNYALLTTDGYWNGNAGLNISGNAIGNQDNVANTSAPLYVDRATTGTLDGLGTVVTTTTPFTETEQAKCTANTTVTMSTGATSRTCGCSAGQTRIVQRVRTYSTSTPATDGVTGTTTTSSFTDTFSNFTACTTPLVSTSVTPTTIVEQQVVIGNANSAFSAVNGVTTGANQAGVCTANQRRIKERTTTFNTTVVTTDGVAGSPTVSGTAYKFSDPGTCTSVVTTAITTPVTLTEEQLVAGNSLSTFPAIGGITAGANEAGICTSPQRRIKRRITTYTSTVVTTDGVAAPAVITGVSYAFSNPGSCTSQVIRRDTPVTVTDEQVLIGNASSTFPQIGGQAGENQAGVCTGGQRRIKRRVTTYTSRVNITDGNPGTASIIGVSYNFSNPGSCISVVTTDTTPKTDIQDMRVVGNNNSAFTAIGTHNPQQAGTCGGGSTTGRTKRRTTTYDSQVVTTDGVTAPATTTNHSSSFQNIGTCQASGTTITTRTTPVTEVAQVREQTTPTGFSAALDGTNNQTAFTSCSSSQRSLIQRTHTYNKVETLHGATVVNTVFNNSSSTFAVLFNCGPNSGGGAVPAAAATTVTNGTATSVTLTSTPTTISSLTTGATTSNTTGTYPTAAASSTVNGAFTDTTITPYPTPASNSTVNGATASNTVGTYPTAAASTSSTGTATVTDNGGTNLTIVLSPNPQNVAGAASTSTTPGGSSDTLADVAMYYYKTDLRTTGSFSKNNVPVSGKYVSPHQHMVTFTLGLGLDGQMLYREDYETATAGDFFKIKTAATNCIWTTGTCNWPTPVGDTATAIDDLWHAAVNGRGKYFSAKVPGTVEAGIKETLAAINVATGSAAAAATSTPNLTTTNNSLYSSTYRTVNWDGELVARSIDPSTGTLLPGIKWSAATQLNAKTSNSADTRNIYTFDGTNATTKLKSFLYANLTAAEKAYFDSKCVAANWNQCSLFTSDATRTANADNGANLVNYLRGQRGNELSADKSTGLYRKRDFVLGDTINSKPAFMGPPELQFLDTGYASFKSANANRTNTLFVAANDGMLHAFNGDTGDEMWAYTPKQVLPNLYTLANSSYDNAHRYFVDGSPSVGEAYLGGTWKSVLVGGLNSGGRGYYALDVTDPANPKAMWEICADALLCAISDVDMGLTYGPAVIGKMPAGGPNAGTWVAIVTSGYNNVGGVGGDGGGYLYVLDLATGAVLHKVATAISGTNVGSLTTPSGLARVSSYVTSFNTDNTMLLIYGGDLLGNMWKFDLAGASGPTVKRIAQLKDGSTPPKPQSITTAPEVTRFDAGFNVLYVGTGRLLGLSDIGDPASQSPALPFAYQQTLYAFKDTDSDLGSGTLRATDAKLVKQTLTVVDAATRSVSNNDVNWTTNNGWYIDFNPVCAGAGCAAGGESPGERVNIDLQLVRGTLVALTNEPNAEECSTGGDSFIYQFRYDSGSFIAGTPGGVAGSKLGNALVVGLVIFQTTAGQIKGIATDAKGQQLEQSVTTAGGVGGARRAAWRELLDTRTSATGEIQ